MVCQDLFDLGNSRKFGKYLFNTEQYEFASKEFERVVFLDPRDTSSVLFLVKCYRKTAQYDMGIQAIKLHIDPITSNLQTPFADEYFKLLVLKDNYHSALNFLENNSYLTEKSRKNYQLSTYILMKKWDEAVLLGNESPGINAKLKELAQEGLEIKYKSPALAMSLSAIIPGTGKMYTKNWKDGIITFLFVGGTAF